MLRLTTYMRILAEDAGLIAPPAQNGATRRPPPHVGKTGPVVIWNLVRRCNLTCRHCYALSADKDFDGELTFDEVGTVMDDLNAFDVPVLILSGGEPMLRPDIHDIGKRAKALGFYVGLSTNGTLITPDTVGAIADVNYDYVGISLDGLGATHDRFRRLNGAFDLALNGMRYCRDAGIKVGLRFTVTTENVDDLPGVLDLADDEEIPKFYLSHLNYAGRGNHNRATDTHHVMTRDVMDMLFERCLEDVVAGREREYVTGNNDADGVYLYLWAQNRFPNAVERLHRRLMAWGGNASGVAIANIDNLGNVHPDTMWWNHTLDNVRNRPFSEIWMDTRDPLQAFLKARPRSIRGRCGACQHFTICGGNTRTRAFQLTGDIAAEDPGCYLTDEEIGNHDSQARLAVTAFSHAQRHHQVPSATDASSGETP